MKQEKKTKEEKPKYIVFGSPMVEEPEIEEMIKTLRSGWLGTGPKTSQFENMMSELTGAKYAMAVNSCTAALHLSLIASDIGKGDEVITTPMTFCATANAIIHSGATPVFVDVDIKTMNIDETKIEKAITPKTKAIMPVHLAGRPCEMDKIMEIAKKHNLIVIEDAAHAIGAEYKGKKIGNIADLTCFSFYVTKNITTGEGGMVLTNNEKFANKIKILALHGMSKDAWKRFSDDGYKHYEVIYPGFKYNMMDIQASLGIHQIKRIEKYDKIRKQIWDFYNEELKDLPIILPSYAGKNIKHVMHLYTVLIDEKKCGISRDKFMQEMHLRGVGTGVHYNPVHLHKYYSDTFGYKVGDYPNAEYIGERTVSLPLSAKLTMDEAKRVAEAVKDVLKKEKGLTQMPTQAKKIKVALMSYAMDNRMAKGTALYARKLIEGLLDDDRFDFYLVHYDKVSDPLYKKAHEIILPKVKLPFGSRFVSQLLFFWKYRNDRFDVIHWFQPRVYPFYWLAPAKKIIITAHGAGDITAPQHFIFSRFVFNFILVHFHKKVSVVIADSESAKSEITEHYKLPPHKVKSIYLGGGENYKPMDKNEAKEIVAKKYGINGSYILDIARLQPHKNIKRLIEAYELLRKNNKEIKQKLVIVGRPTSNHVEEYEVAKKSDFSADILFVGYVDAGDLNAMYSGSDAFVFPSLSEGFGLPVLEAMASGTPVVTSNIESMPEIGGEAVIAVNPLDVNEISAGIQKVLTDKNLVSKMTEAGLRRAKEFSWKEMVSGTEELYKKNCSQCYFCGLQSEASAIGSHFDKGVEYTLHECLVCHVQYWTPFKNPGAEWYENDLRYAGRNIDPDMEPNWHQRKTIIFLNSLKGKLLDVGCGAGTFMHWAKKMGWDVSGIDFDRDAIRAGKEIFKLDKIEDVDLGGYLSKHAGLKFDLVTFFDVFEHIDNHNEFLGQIGDALVPGGHIALSTPYRKGARWLQSNDLPPRHLSRWDRSTITHYLDRRGFRVVYVRRLSEGLGFLVTKLRRKYGKYVSFGIVGKLKNKTRKDGKIELGSSAEKSISRVHTLARVKDWVIFGAPAAVIWLAMLFSSKRYITLFVIAQKK